MDIFQIESRHFSIRSEQSEESFAVSSNDAAANTSFLSIATVCPSSVFKELKNKQIHNECYI